MRVSNGRRLEHDIQLWKVTFSLLYIALQFELREITRRHAYFPVTHMFQNLLSP